jgi:hypothetical protein
MAQYVVVGDQVNRWDTETNSPAPVGRGELIELDDAEAKRIGPRVVLPADHERARRVRAQEFPDADDVHGDDAAAAAVEPPAVTEANVDDPGRFDGQAMRLPRELREGDPQLPELPADMRDGDEVSPTEGKPARSASKAEWEAWAAKQGDAAPADKTKDELVRQYG